MRVVRCRASRARRVLRAVRDVRAYARVPVGTLEIFFRRDRVESACEGEFGSKARESASSDSRLRAPCDVPQGLARRSATLAPDDSRDAQSVGTRTRNGTTLTRRGGRVLGVDERVCGAGRTRLRRVDRNGDDVRAPPSARRLRGAVGRIGVCPRQKAISCEFARYEASRRREVERMDRPMRVKS
jgi:hypothetical protein